MYADLIPGELMMLKYYRRRLDIAASTNDAPSIKEIGADVLQIWSALRPAVEARGGVAEAQRFNDLVDTRISREFGPMASTEFFGDRQSL